MCAAALSAADLVKNGARCLPEGIALDIFLWMEFQLCQPNTISG
jgi:hypothetical protein